MTLQRTVRGARPQVVLLIRVLAFTTALATLIALVAGVISPASAVIASVFVVLAAGVALSQPSHDRRLSMGFFALAFAVRSAVVLVLHLTGNSVASLGPDATAFLEGSRALADANLVLPQHPIDYFGTQDVAHYYLFAASIVAFGAGLTDLQLLNAGVGALVAPVAFAWCRILSPRHAVLVACVVAVHPSLAVLSSTSLLKDAAILLAALSALWSITRLLASSRARDAALSICIATVSLIYLHTDRFYVVVLIEGAILSAAIAMWASGRRREVPIRRVGTAAVVFVLAEFVPGLFGWQTTPVLFAQNIEHVRQTTSMRDYGPGLADQLLTGRAQPSPSASVRASPRYDLVVTSVESMSAPIVAQGSDKATLKATATPDRVATPNLARPRLAPNFANAGSRTATGSSPANGTNPTQLNAAQSPSPNTSVSSSTDFVVVGADLLRRLFGPFVWVMPSTLGSTSIWQTDLLLYPGMLLWYALLPLGLAGIASALLRIRREPATKTALAVFLCLYLAMYLAINLSYRQRDFLVPFLLIFAIPVLMTLLRDRRRRLAYAAYWLALIALGGYHVALRNELSSAVPPPASGNSLAPTLADDPACLSIDAGGDVLVQPGSVLTYCSGATEVSGWSVSDGSILAISARRLVWQAPSSEGTYGVGASSSSAVAQRFVLVSGAELPYDFANASWYSSLVQQILGSAPATDAEMVMRLFSYTFASLEEGYPNATARTSRGFIEGRVVSCDQQVEVFTTFTTTIGLPSRMVFLQHSDGFNGHVVSEVFYDGAWHLFDPNHGVVYRRADGVVAAHAEILAQPDLVDAVADLWISSRNGVGMRGFYETHALRYVSILTGRVVTGENEELYRDRWARTVFAVSEPRPAEVAAYIYEYPGNDEPVVLLINGNLHEIRPDQSLQGAYHWRKVGVPAAHLRSGANEIEVRASDWTSWSLATVKVDPNDVSSESSSDRGQSWQRATGVNVASDQQYLIVIDFIDDISASTRAEAVGPD